MRFVRVAQDSSPPLPEYVRVPSTSYLVITVTQGSSLTTPQQLHISLYGCWSRNSDNSTCITSEFANEQNKALYIYDMLISASFIIHSCGNFLWAALPSRAPLCQVPIWLASVSQGSHHGNAALSLKQIISVAECCASPLQKLHLLFAHSTLT